MGRKLVISDVHGMFERLISALSSAGFNPAEDVLYAVGDFCDRGPDSVKVLDYLMELPHFFPVMGNHDMWLYEYLCGRGPAPIWLDPRNGGMITYNAIKNMDSEKKAKIRQWLGSFPLVRECENNIILHAGPPCGVKDEHSLLRLTDGMTLEKAFRIKSFTGSYISIVNDIVWNRDYIRTAIRSEAEPGDVDCFSMPFETDKVLICGHTPLKKVFHSDKYHITCIDTGSFAPDGHITVMDLDSGKHCSS